MRALDSLPPTHLRLRPSQHHASQPRFLQAADNVRALMDSLPPMRPLVMVLKVFLQQRELNEVRGRDSEAGLGCCQAGVVEIFLQQRELYFLWDRSVVDSDRP